jgi:UDP-N-acetyl-D-mannosaminuronic acid transferase (WecB/TagA/CpsF family)
VPGERLGQAGRSAFRFGGCPEAVETAAKDFESRTSARVIGWRHRYVDLSPDSLDGELIVDLINSLRPDVLVVRLGILFQEEWLPSLAGARVPPHQGDFPSLSA